MFERFISLVDGTKTLIIVGLIGLDFLLGILTAIFKDKNFEFQKVADFLITDVGLAIGYYALGFVASLVTGLVADVAVFTAFSAFVLTVGSMVLAKIKRLGIPVPEVLTK